MPWEFAIVDITRPAADAGTPEVADRLNQVINRIFQTGNVLRRNGVAPAPDPLSARRHSRAPPCIAKKKDQTNDSYKTQTYSRRIEKPHTPLGGTPIPSKTHVPAKPEEFGRIAAGKAEECRRRQTYRGNYVARYLDEVAPANISGRIIKFSKDCKFVTPDDETEVSEDQGTYRPKMYVRVRVLLEPVHRTWPERYRGARWRKPATLRRPERRSCRCSR